MTIIPLEVDMLLMDFARRRFVNNCRKTELSVKTWPTLRRLVPVLVLDELWRRWPKGQKTNDAPMADRKLLAEHRHRVNRKTSRCGL
ncbi:hypothetical protein [Pseudomonas aeruginosa]|uniref:hypothetical protein n=1 Tax=Pseudomonas aeruginosa TaxID=287 RepID=UPI0021B319D0|nr:hypothetical protein [Pseudomonas aeruginosa]MCT7418588.1 hypothetical protein [Pseudomonas aeruginosa]